MILVASMGEVHAHNIQASLAQLVDRLDRVRLGPDGADDRRPAEVPLGLERRIKLGQPCDLAAKVQVVESGRHYVEPRICDIFGWGLRGVSAGLRF